MSHSMPTRNWFQPGEGIAREVITADIQRYLGPDALVRPGTNEEGVEGYWITAYRTLTSQMVQDLRLDSQRWRQEVQQGRGSPQLRDPKAQRQPDKLLVAYQDSTTHRSRQYYGPSTPAPGIERVDRGYQQPAPPSSYNVDPRDQSQYRAPVSSAYSEPAYTYAPQPPQGQPQTGYPVQPGYAPPRTASGYPPYGQSSREEPQHYQAPYADQRADPRVTYPAGYPAQVSTPTSGQPMYSSPQQSQSTYYTTDGRTYAPGPHQQNTGRRRQ